MATLTVSATPGTTYRFSFYGRGRGTNEASPAASETNLQMNMRAGIDPNGGTAWNDADVVWSDDGSPHDTWQQFSVEAFYSQHDPATIVYPRQYDMVSPSSPPPTGP